MHDVLQVKKAGLATYPSPYRTISMVPNLLLPTSQIRYQQIPLPSSQKLSWAWDNVILKVLFDGNKNIISVIKT